MTSPCVCLIPIALIPRPCRTSFFVPPMGHEAADYFDASRRKPNEIDYTGAAIATGTEADELVLHVKALVGLVERWIDSTNPTFKRW